MSNPTLRPIASAEDREACAQIFVDSFAALHASQGLMGSSHPAEDRAFLAEVLEHFMGTDPELQWLAELGGEPVGFASAWRRDPLWFLAFLFVRPDAQADGLGRTLLEKVLPSEEERDDLIMSTVIEATQPVSQALYARYGMVPRTPRPLLTGVPRDGVLPDELPSGVEAIPLSTVDPDQIEAFERLHLGHARGPHHARFDAGGGGYAFAYRRSGLLAGFGYVRIDPELGLRIQPVLTGDASLMPAAIAHLWRHGGGRRVEFPIYGGARRLMPLLLEAGLHIESFHQEEHFPFLYCSTHPAPDADRVIPYSGYLP